MARRTKRTPAEEAPGLFDAASTDQPYTVAQLTGEIQARVEALGRVRVEGELSGLKRHTSGHVYFDLKDEHARLNCKIWRSRASQALRFEPEEGMKVVATGKMDVYPPRGTYSLVVERLEPLGVGALLARLEELKVELGRLGWFERHRDLPALPRCVGLVTSRDGAALRDFLRTRSLRWPGYPVRLCHSAMQGPGAAPEIAAAVGRLAASGVDVIVLSRGGGSLEDLWSFNERVVAEAIWQCGVPVVTGVGHESDTTLADLVADHRAHTPTDAAQTVIPDRAALFAELARWGNFLVEAMDAVLEERTGRLEALAGRRALRDASWILGERRLALSSLGTRLGSEMSSALHARERSLGGLLRRVERQSPAARVERWITRLGRSADRLTHAAGRTLERAENRFDKASGTLHSVSPLAVLGRGYSLTRRRGEARPLTDAAGLAVGEELHTRLARGALVSRILEVEGGEEA